MKRMYVYAGCLSLAGFAFGCSEQPPTGVTSDEASLSTTNGLNGINGLNSHNGLNSFNGLNSHNGLNSYNGLNTYNGLMTTSQGRQTVAYMVRCALAAGDTLVKQDQYNNNYTFQGSIGLVPQYKDDACDTACQEQISACMLAHVNTTGVHIPLWMVSPMTAIGWGQSNWYPTREGTFFGNIFTPDASGTVRAHYCTAPSVASNTVPGRLGASQSGTPYTDPYAAPGVCDSSCTMFGSDGPSACPADGRTWSYPITVWRGQTFQAETGLLGPGANKAGCAASCGGGFRVSMTADNSSVTFNKVNAAAYGAHDVYVYYTNGDAKSRFFGIRVNNGPLQTFAANQYSLTNDWSQVFSMVVSLSGFKAGSNTITISADGTHSVPDLDWVEVMAGASTTLVPLPATSTTASSSHKGNVAAYATDNKSSTRWESQYTDNQWLTVDVGASRTISRVNILWESAYAKAYNLRVSNDKATWTTVRAVTNGQGGTDSFDLPDGIVARYVQMQGVTRNWTVGYAIWEMQIYGSPCDRSNWKATASTSVNASSPPLAAVDGNPTTSWTSGRTQNNTDWYQVDFGGQVKLSSLTLTTPPTNSGDFPGGIALFGSIDGVTWETKPFATAVGDGPTMVLDFGQRITQAVRVMQVAPARSSNWWQIGELQASCSM